jgi:hypothetical protein
MCVKVLEAVSIEQRPEVHARLRFTLSPVDVGRLESSAEFIAELGDVLVRDALWPDDIPAPRKMSEDVVLLAQRWSTDEITDVCLAEAVQHGDLNPGNVMIDSDGVPVLIDFQRLGRWPLGYDLARLSGLLRIRVTDAASKEDWLPFKLRSWVKDSEGIGLEANGRVSICSEAHFCEAEFLRYISGLPVKQQTRVRYGFYLGALWDLLKICSYQDISVFKRAWALSMAWRLSRNLRLSRTEMLS